jgi:hypothetical protein
LNKEYKFWNGFDSFLLLLLCRKNDRGRRLWLVPFAERVAQTCENADWSFFFAAACNESDRPCFEAPHPRGEIIIQRGVSRFALLPAMQPANDDNIIVRPDGRRPDLHFEAMIAQLRPGNVDPFDGQVDLRTVVLTNPMAERLGQALLATNRTVTKMVISLESMTPEGSEYYPSLLRFLESSVLGEMAVTLYGSPAIPPAEDERINRTVTTILSSMHRNAEASFALHLRRMALLPSVLSLATEYLRFVEIYSCTITKNNRETTGTRPVVPVASPLAPCWVRLCWDGETLPNEAREVLAALANSVARPLYFLSCTFLGLGLSVQLAQSILDLARRQDSPIGVFLCFDTIAWEAGSIEILTQNCSAIKDIARNGPMYHTESANRPARVS